MAGQRPASGRGRPALNRLQRAGSSSLTQELDPSSGAYIFGLTAHAANPPIPFRAVTRCPAIRPAPRCSPGNPARPPGAPGEAPPGGWSANECWDSAERADAQSGPDAESLPEDLRRREKLKAKLDRACAKLDRRARSQAAADRAAYERKVAARDQREGRAKGAKIKEPGTEPRPEEQINLTDSDSALMRKNKRSEWRQAYNAQAVVDAHGSQLVLGSRVSSCASDRRELVADVETIPKALGEPGRVLADNGYASGSKVARLEGRGLKVLVAVGAGREPGTVSLAQADGGAGVRDREGSSPAPRSSPDFTSHQENTHEHSSSKPPLVRSNHHHGHRIARRSVFALRLRNSHGPA